MAKWLRNTKSKQVVQVVAFWNPFPLEYFVLAGESNDPSNKLCIVVTPDCCEVGGVDLGVLEKEVRKAKGSLFKYEGDRFMKERILPPPS